MLYIIKLKHYLSTTKLVKTFLRVDENIFCCLSAAAVDSCIIGNGLVVVPLVNNYCLGSSEGLIYRVSDFCGRSDESKDGDGVPDTESPVNRQ